MRLQPLAVTAALVAAVVVLTAPAAAYGAFAEQVARLHAYDAATNDFYGHVVDIDGDTAVVGSPWDDSERGSVYVYTRSAAGWAFQQKLTAPVRAVGDHFGFSAAVSGDVVVVGAPGRTVSAQGAAGSIYIYRRVGGIWQAPTIVNNPAAQAGEHYGWSVDIDGTTMVVGEPESSGTIYGPHHGFARVYGWNGASWALQAGLEDTEVDGSGALLGWDVAVSGTTVITGCPAEDSGRESVSVWGWNGATWIYKQKLQVAGGAASDQFGQSVDISGNTLVGGAPGRDLMTGMDAGAAYVYVNPGDAWEWQASLISPDPSEYKGFGSGVGIDGNTLAIGEWQGSAGAGAAHFYRRSGTLWPRVQSTDMSAADPAVRMFGCSTAVSNGTIIIGSYLASSATVTEPGGAFIYSHLEPVYRFYKPSGGTHFYTPSTEERDHVLATWPSIFSYEGVVYKTNPENNPQPLYRFFNHTNGSHFYTASLVEADHVIATWPSVFTYEGQTYAVTPWPCAGPTVYRFYNLKNGSHFYTASAEEADMVIATWPTVYRYEGPVFWLGQ